MKTHCSFWSIVLLCLFYGLFTQPLTTFANGPDTLARWAVPFAYTFENEFKQLQRELDTEIEPLQIRLNDVSLSLNDPRNRTADKGFVLLWERDQLRDIILKIEEEYNIKMLKLRYRKGIEIVKMLYEKILSMDHHFSSMKAQQGLSNMCNPNSYTEFKDIKTVLDDKMKKKFNFQMPALFQANPYLSAAFTVVGMVTSLGEGNHSEKKESLEKMSCILDFTVRMHGDLNTIYYETGYLRDANLTLKKECETLFAECSRQVGYTIPLVSCRESDDWERLYTMLDTYVGKALGEGGPTAAQPAGGYGMPAAVPAGNEKLMNKANINLQFSIDRVTQFIDKYSNFVGQGSEYHKKFAKIVDNYENEKQCADAMPAQYKQLKADIEQTLEKFNSAYKMPEVQGSKLKDMLYGGLVE
jgi:hypothetical protein